MALSDSCFEFLQAFGKAAETLAREAHYYSDPTYPLRYGKEVDALRRAAALTSESPYDPEAGARLLRLATSVMQYLDTPPGEEANQRQAEMRQLITILQSELDPEEAAAVPAVIQHVVAETPYTEGAVGRLKQMLGRLGATSYEVAVKVITDIASATAKKMLGL